MAGQFLKSLGEFFGGAATSGVTNIVDSVGETIDRFAHTGDEKVAAELAKKELQLKVREMENELKMAYLNDRQSARSMYAHDSTSQKILTIIFTVGYFAITSVMIALVFKLIQAADLNDFVIAFISSIFGAFQAIMVQVISFYFGSSQGGENQGERIAEAFKGAAQEKEQSG